MDGFSFHPYPNRATDPLERGYPWPNAGFVNLDRIKQALWDAFRGHAAADDARRPEAVPRRGRLAGRHARSCPATPASRTCPSPTRRRRPPSTASSSRRAVCDPDVAEVNVFGFYDDTARSGVPGRAPPRRRDGPAVGRRRCARRSRSRARTPRRRGCRSEGSSARPSRRSPRARGRGRRGRRGRGRSPARLRAPGALPLPEIARAAGARGDPRLSQGHRLAAPAGPRGRSRSSAGGRVTVGVRLTAETWPASAARSRRASCR